MSEQGERSPDRDAHPLRRVTGHTFESLIDQHIRQAEADGQFQNLRGAGKPLDLDDDKDVPEELRVGFRMLKNAGYAPPWIELQKSIREDQAALEAWRARANQRWPRLGEGDRVVLRAEYEQRLRDLNKQIANYNLVAPAVVGQIALLQPWRELRKLGS